MYHQFEQFYAYLPDRSSTETGIIYGAMRHLGDDADPAVFLKTFPIFSILSKMARRYKAQTAPM